MGKVNYQPEGYSTVSPALAFSDATAALAWYADNLGAKEKMRFEMPDGSIAHAEMILGDTVVMVAQENPQYNKSPETLGGVSVKFHIGCDDVDAAIIGNDDAIIPLCSFGGDQFVPQVTGDKIKIAIVSRKNVKWQLDPSRTV